MTITTYPHLLPRNGRVFVVGGVVTPDAIFGVVSPTDNSKSLFRHRFGDGALIDISLKMKCVYVHPFYHQTDDFFQISSSTKQYIHKHK